jgi:hypothetical protein
MQNNQTAGSFTLSPVDLSAVCAEYLRLRFRFVLHGRSSPPIGITMEPPPVSLLLPIRLSVELECIAEILANAFLNRGKQDRSDL